MRPGDRLVCAFIEPQHVGDTFVEWPLHITIVPWFRADVSSDDLGRELSKKLGDLEPFVVTVAGETHFGYRGRKTVNLIHMPSPLQTIEEKTRDLLHGYDAWLVDETTQHRREFKPHITVQQSRRARDGDTFVCDGVYIIEQKGDYKEVESRINL